MAQARYDKLGRRLPDTGHGCGCKLCAETNAPRYERREHEPRPSGTWNPLHRRTIQLVKSLLNPTSRELA